MNNYLYNYEPPILEFVESDDYSFNFGEGTIKYQKYLENINSENIQSKIIEINSIYEEILELNRLIRMTNGINVSDLPKIKEEANNVREKVKIDNEFYIDMHPVMNKLMKNMTKNNITKYKELDNKIRKNRSESKQISDQFVYHNNIIDIHKKLNSNIYIDKDIAIKAYEIIRYSNEIKKRLKEIYEEYHGEDFIRDLLLELYQKQLEWLKI